MVSRQKIVRASAALAALGATLTLGLAGNSPASADPKQLESVVKAGVGSDTTQDVLNALAGYSNGVSYLPVQGGAVDAQLISYDASGTSCITTKLNGPSFNRPNGSSAGQRALSRALDGGVYGNTTCGAAKAIGGQVDFARSSSLDSTAGSTLSYVPMGRDGLSFGYYRANGSPITSLTRSQLQTIYTTGSLTVSGVRIIPCGIQTSSGTHQSWTVQALALGANSAAADPVEAAGTAECNGLINPATSTAFGRSQENEGPALIARGNAADAAVDGTQVIIGFSGAAFVAKSNNLGTPNPGVVRLGSITDDGAGNNIGAPVAEVTPGVWTPVQSFYNNVTFGRTVYNVLPASRINSGGATNLDLKGLFSGASSEVCLAIAQLDEYGFTPDPNCGNTTINLRGYRSGAL